MCVKKVKNMKKIKKDGERGNMGEMLKNDSEMKKIKETVK